MASLGIDYGTGSWKTALLVEGRSPELRNFAGADEVRASIAGGRYSPLVAHLGLRDARDRVLDWIYR